MTNASPRRNVGQTGRCESFLLLDFLHCFWRFMVESASKDSLSFHKPFVVFTPTRVPHSASNSVSYFKSFVEDLFAQPEVSIWLYDTLAYARICEVFLKNLDHALQICATKGLNINPRKCHLVLKEAQSCERIFFGNGVRFNPHNYDELLFMTTQKTTGALMELVPGANCMRTAIPRFSELVATVKGAFRNAVHDI